MEAGGIIAERDGFYFKNKPPEAMRGGYQFGLVFDIYQFGLTLYRMCNGDDIFYDQFGQFFDEDDNFDRDRFLFAVRNGRFPDRSRFLDHIPEKLRRACKTCLSVDPAERFQSAIAVSNALSQIEEGYLDWVYKEEDGCKIWKRNVEGTEYEFSVAQDGTTEMHKSVNGGDARRVVKFCTDRMTSRQIRTALGEVS